MLLIKNLSKTVGIYLVCLVLLGCAFLQRKVDDLRLEKLDIVGLNSEPDSPILSRFLLRDEVAIKVRISSSLDLGGLAESGGLNVTFRVNTCSVQEDKELSYWPTVYLDGIEVGFIGVSASERAHYRAAASHILPPQRFQYDVYILGREPRRKQSVNISYDLLSNPFDICLRLSGGNMTGGALRSNTVRIDRDTIIKAVQSRSHR